MREVSPTPRPASLGRRRRRRLLPPGSPKSVAAAATIAFAGCCIASTPLNHLGTLTAEAAFSFAPSPAPSPPLAATMTGMASARPLSGCGQRGKGGGIASFGRNRQIWPPRTGTGTSTGLLASVDQSGGDDRDRDRGEKEIIAKGNDGERRDVVDDAWESSLALADRPYVSSLLRDMDPTRLAGFLASLSSDDDDDPEDCLEALLMEGGDFEDDEEEGLEGAAEGRGRGRRSAVVDPLWEQVKMEARHQLSLEGGGSAGPQLYQGVLSQPSLLYAVCSKVAHEVETELMPATGLRNLFLAELTPEDERCISLDIMAAAMRSPSVGTAMGAVLFNKGLHALVCHRVAHRLWRKGRTGLAMYMQSTVSSRYSADIHPAARIGAGIYLNAGAGVVVGETAVVGDDVTILQGVTLGGTGKERGDRHPKIGDGVVLHDSSTVLGNIRVGDGAVVTAKSIVTKPVPALARVAGVPARIFSYRMPRVPDLPSDEGEDSGFVGCAERHLRYKYLQSWERASSPGAVVEEGDDVVVEREEVVLEEMDDEF